MPYKYQGFGAGPTTPEQNAMLGGIVLTAVVIYALFCYAMLSYGPV